MEKKTEEFINDENVADPTLEESNNLDSIVDQQQKKSKKPLFVAVVILVLFGASLGAAYKWHSQIQEYKLNQSEADKQVAQLEKQVSELKSLSSGNSQKAANDLVIKEWAVKLSSQSEELVIDYEIDQNTPDIARFVSSQQKSLGGDCGTFSSSRYYIFRAKSGYSSTDDVFANKLKAAMRDDRSVKIGENTYYIIDDMSGGDCTGKLKAGDSMSAEEAKANSKLLAALKSIAATN